MFLVSLLCFPGWLNWETYVSDGKFVSAKQKCFWLHAKNIFCFRAAKFVSATHISLAAKLGNICIRNNVSEFSQALKITDNRFTKLPPLNASCPLWCCFINCDLRKANRVLQCPAGIDRRCQVILGVGRIKALDRPNITKCLCFRLNNKYKFSLVTIICSQWNEKK